MSVQQKRKDSRRADLVIPYQQPTQKNELSDLAGTMISTLPMAAMFTRNKYMGWAAIVFSIQAWLTESPEQKASASQPALMSVGMALISLVVTYMNLFMVPPMPRGYPAEMPPMAS